MKHKHVAGTLTQPPHCIKCGALMPKRTVMPAGTEMKFFTLQSDDDGIVFFATRKDAETTRRAWIKAAANNVSSIEEHEILVEGFEVKEAGALLEVKKGPWVLQFQLTYNQKWTRSGDYPLEYQTREEAHTVVRRAQSAQSAQSFFPLKYRAIRKCDTKA